MERKTVRFEVKAAVDGVIEGYGSVFGNVDLGNDVVERGAFAETLKARRKIKMLRDHDPRKVVGVWDKVSEDNDGLRVKGRLAMTTQLGRETFDLIEMGAMEGLSIGYKTLEDEIIGDVRHLKEVRLFEVSVVPFPMNEAAVIDMAKAEQIPKIELERRLTQDAKLSRSVARALLGGGYEALRVKQDADDDRAKLEAALRRLSKA